MLDKTSRNMDSVYLKALGWRPNAVWPIAPHEVHSGYFAKLYLCLASDAAANLCADVSLLTLLIVLDLLDLRV